MDRRRTLRRLAESGALGAPTSSALRAVLYARVSTGAQSCEAQLEELARVSVQRGWRVVATIADTGSGARGDLAGRLELLELARRARTDVVAVWRLDRLGRSVRDLVEAAAELEAAGVQLVSLHESIDTSSPAGRLMFHVLAAVAELEREVIRDRVVAGIERARRKGVRIGRPRAPVDVDGALERLELGQSRRAVARALGISARTLGRVLEEKRGETPSSSPARSPAFDALDPGAGGRGER